MEVDPVVLQLRADVAQYRREVSRVTGDVERLLGRQGAAQRKLEAEMKRSNAAISNTLKGLAATIAGAVTGRELIGLIDGFTRLQNELRVAGLEGANLTGVQERLFAIANENGVAINSLADLYGKAAQTGKELGASQEQLISLTEATALGLRISGTNAQAAAGAILGLSQALSSGVVRAEEFNQINEGGLRPLLQAAAASDRFGGSVAKLRAAVLDGKLSSQEFFQAILAGTTQLQGKAANATLTLGGAFETLNNKLIEFVGGAASASGATGIIADGIKALADNLDTIIPALATIAVALGVQTVGGALAASRAMFALQAAMLGAATTTEALKFALAGLKGALPIIAITALIGGMIFLAQRSGEATKATGAYAVAQRQAADASSRATKLAQDLATAHGKVRSEALAAARAEAENTKQKLAGARASLVLAQAELKKAGAYQLAQNAASLGGGVAGTGSFIQGQGDRRVAQARGNVTAVEGAIKTLEASLKTVQGAISAATAPPVASVVEEEKKKDRAPKGPTGPTVEEIERRFADELTGYTQQTLAARQQLASNADERAELELRSLEHARRQTLASIKADEDYSKAQKDDLALQVEQMAVRERELVEFRRRVENERVAQDLADERFQAEQDALRLQLDLANTQADRRAIAFRILDAEESYLKSKLEAVIVSQTATDAERERARIALAALNATAGAREASLGRQYSSPLARYAEAAKDADDRVEAAAAQRIADLNDTIADAMTNALGIEDPFLRDLIGIFLDRNIFGPLAEGLSKQGGGLLGGLVDIVGSIFGRGPTNLLANTPYGGGRAIGGPVNAGTAYLVGERGPELMIPRAAGMVVPNHLINANATQPAASGGVVRLMIEEAPGFASRVQVISAETAVEVTRVTAPQLIDAAANETLRRANRPGL